MEKWSLTPFLFELSKHFRVNSVGSVTGFQLAGASSLVSLQANVNAHVENMVILLLLSGYRLL